MEHSHHHHDHHHVPEIANLNRAFIIGIFLNIAFVITEFIIGFNYNSLGLISDAGHNLSDVVSLALALLAFRLARVSANSTYTYGYKKSTILVSLFNAIILLIAVGVIFAESLNKLFNPSPLEGVAIAWTAGVGVFINGITAWLFMKDSKKDLNVKGAYLHMAADALVSVGVVISGIVISYTGWYVIDPIIGLLIACVIVYSTWNLLRDSLKLSLDGVPSGTESSEIMNIILSVPEILSCHHLHIWALSTTEVALTAHLVVNDLSHLESLKRIIKEKLMKAGIRHATLEFERNAETCCDETCNSLNEVH